MTGAVIGGGTVTSERAIATARALAPEIARGASARDAEKALPFDQVDALSSAGLFALTVPAEYGGPGLPVSTVATVTATIAAADASVSQIPQSHYTFLDAARREGSDVLRQWIFERVLGGARVANAQTEIGGRTTRDDSTALRRSRGGLVLSGTKYYCTGAVFADILAVRAVGPDGRAVIAYIPADAQGVSIGTDWDALGQRTTSSGTVILDDVEVDPDLVLDFTGLLDRPSTYGARAQLLHAAIDTGIARGAVDTIAGLAGRARPWFEAGVDRAADDPLLIAQAGDLELAVRSAEALLVVAGDRIHHAETIPGPETVSGPEAIAEASLATAAVKVAAGRAARRAGSELFDFGGTRTAAGSATLSRYWRDARTHTLHDPERWKLHHLGRWALGRVRPPSHGTL